MSKKTEIEQEKKEFLKAKTNAYNKFMKLLIKKGLKVKEALCGDKRLNYFRGIY